MGYVESSWEIQKMFYDEVRDKKRTGYGGFHNVTHRGGGKKGANLKTQMDFLQGKAKREYMKAGVIVVSNIYDQIEAVPSINEIHLMDFEVAKNLVTMLREKFTNKILQEHWKVSSGTMYSKIHYKYGLVVRQKTTEGADYVPRKYHRKGTPEVVEKVTPFNEYKSESLKAQAKLKVEAEASYFNDLNESNKIKEELSSIQKLTTKIMDLTTMNSKLELEIKKSNEIPRLGFALKDKGSFTGEQIVERVLKYVGTLTDKSRYYIDMDISEILQKAE